jgi:hypothetical protein
LTSRRVPAVLVVLAVASCSSGGSASKTDFAGVLCPTVEAWSDQSVAVVNAFSDQSLKASGPSQRRQYYADAFTGLGHQLDDLSTRFGRLPAPSQQPDAVRSALSVAITAMRAALRDASSASTALPDADYEIASVTDGRLFTGLEKNQAIVYQALSDLSDTYGPKVVPRGCGRRGPVDLSPGVTAP